MENGTCFECLQRRIRSDFSDKLVFSRALSGSPLPFGSAAVVQTKDSSIHFELHYLPYLQDDCLPQYIDQYSPNDQHPDQPEVSSGLVSDKPNSFEIKSTEFHACNLSCKFPCVRTITALAPVARIGPPFLDLFEDHNLSGSVEDHILQSITLLIQGKPTGRDSVNFFRLIGIPSFENSNVFPGCIRHPNIAPILGTSKVSCGGICLLLPVSEASHTLENVLHYSPDVFRSDWHIRFLLYQLLSAVAYLHGLGVAHGYICPSNIRLTNNLWCLLPIEHALSPRTKLSSGTKECDATSPPSSLCCFEDCSSPSLYSGIKLSQSVDWQSSFYSWWKGELSNFEYLLILNQLAGRSWGDHAFYIVMPWVIDFSVKPDGNSDSGWRDLSKSKWRLAKGDEQLDFTYSTSEIAHHVSDECLSELAVCSYKARRLPLSVLRMAVRSVYEPNEYPSSMQRLYQWTPDECIPEFYCDPRIFYSLHSGMADLAVPSWAGTPEEFIKLHRDALESYRVSCQIHHWIDITFGYKMSGDAAIAAKNVMLSPSGPTMPRSTGRRQLFSKPHPARQVPAKATQDTSFGSDVDKYPANCVASDLDKLVDTVSLDELEKAAAFCEHSLFLNPVYNPHLCEHSKLASSELSVENTEKMTPGKVDWCSNYQAPVLIDLNYLLKRIEVDEDNSVGYPELLLWQHRSSSSMMSSEVFANDIFSIGCILAELHLRRPLFNSNSLALYLESGVFPRMMQELPPQTQVFVEACIQRDWRRRPSPSCLLESPYFSATVRASYLFLAPLQLLAKDEVRCWYASSFANLGSLKAMGPLSAQMCLPECIALVTNSSSENETECAYILLKKFLECLSPEAVKELIFPPIQKVLQARGDSSLKVSLLQISFMQEIWDRVGRQSYLERIHPSVLSNLLVSPRKDFTVAASVLLIGSSEELGVPIAVHQTILPLIQCFGKGLSDDGIEVIARIGGVFGDKFIVKHILPLLRSVLHSCITISGMNKPETMQTWSTQAIKDCLMTLHGLIAFLPQEVVVRELIEDSGCLYVQILMKTNIGIQALEVTAKSLIAVCQEIGPDSTEKHVLPKLKELFDDLAFSDKNIGDVSSASGRLTKHRIVSNVEFCIQKRVDLVFLLYPSLASFLGIEKLRQCCPTWLLLEKILLRCHNWKWEYMRKPSDVVPRNINGRRPPVGISFNSDYTHAKIPLTEAGWSIPQSHRNGGFKSLIQNKNPSKHYESSVERQLPCSNLGNNEPWYWFPGSVASWNGPDFVGRSGVLKDDFPWKIRASIIHSVHAHHGALKSFAICRDERTFFTAGVGSGFRGVVSKWELSRIDAISGYNGHEEVVNDICVLSSSGKVASCDGTLHVWNGQTGKAISIISEYSSNSVHDASSLTTASKVNTEQLSMLHFNSLSSGILNTTFNESLYTSMHYLEFSDMLVLGTGNASLRFIDINRAQKLHLWRCESIESSFPSLVSCICSRGSTTTQAEGGPSRPSWIAAGLSSGYCRLLDMRSGNVIASWQAHDGYVTKLAAPDDHLLISSSHDRTLRIWDLRGNWTSEPVVYKGHNDAISGFAIWGQDVISISKNRIGISSLSKSADSYEQRVTAQHLYMADRESKNMSILSSISILPFSRLFLVGTEDGHLKICC